MYESSTAIEQSAGGSDKEGRGKTQDSHMGKLIAS